MSSDEILGPGAEKNLARLYVSGLAEKAVDGYTGYYLLRVLFETGQQGDYLFDRELNLVSSKLAKRDLAAKNPVKISGYKVGRMGREIDAYLVDAGEQDKTAMLEKILQKAI